MNLQSRFRGCLLGGAVGDALGYTVEFKNESQIFAQYGPKGICQPVPDPAGTAPISDDTQMTLFTACGLLNGRTLGENQPYPWYIHRAYLDWLRTQDGEGMEPDESAPASTWLFRVPELNAPRAPGNTCLSALESGKMGSVSQPINNSKGCGGVMRVAPIGLFFPRNQEQSPRQIAALGAEAAAITHGHPLGWLPSALLADLISRIVWETPNSLREALAGARETVGALYGSQPELARQEALLDLAVALSEDNTPVLEAIHQLGEGWVAEETLAIAVYCALKFEDNFEEALIASVNHKGDSDSTGAVTGNILGAWLGVQQIPEAWLQRLEAAPVITTIADDLLTRDGDRTRGTWADKYVFNRYDM